MNSREYIVIRGYGAVSPLGLDREEVAAAYRAGKAAFQVRDFNGVATPVGALPETAEFALKQLSKEKKAYQTLDRSVLMAMLAGRQAVQAAGWTEESRMAINIGSSRGATALFEQYLQEYQHTGTVPSHVSPVTTLGNISSWLAQDLGTAGAAISHSVTCSTGLQAIANGFAWLRSGMAEKMLVGAAEAPLTPFTIAQMKAIGIYSADVEGAYPCRPHNAERKNTFVLGEGAAVFALEKVAESALRKDTSRPIILEGIGFGFETIGAKTGISREGNNFQLAMREALKAAGNDEPVDLVIMHAPGTVAGDNAELRALENVFGENMPMITSSKWLIGHTLGASACLSLDYGIHLLQSQMYVPFPYPTQISSVSTKPIKRILIAAAGFGGNAAAILIKQA